MSGKIISPECQHQARIAKQLIRASGGLEAAEDFSGKSKTQLGRYQSSDDDASITLEVIEALEDVTRDKVGHPVITRYLAKRAGYALIKLPTAPIMPSDMLALVSKQAKESGDITSSVINALSDKKLEAAEISSIRREIHELIEVAVAMECELKLIQDERKG